MRRCWTTTGWRIAEASLHALQLSECIRPNYRFSCLFSVGIVQPVGARHSASASGFVVGHELQQFNNYFGVNNKGKDAGIALKITLFEIPETSY